MRTKDKRILDILEDINKNKKKVSSLGIELKKVTIKDFNINLKDENRNSLKIITVTPTLIRHLEGYWRGLGLKEQDVLESIENNLKKKSEFFNKKTLKGNLIKSIRTLNKHPISVKSHNNTYLCDKYEIEFNNRSDLEYILSIAFNYGIGEQNARGLGYVEFIK